ncbi:hypothetical protein D3C75_1002200 [compost metagenome]
MEPNIYQMEKWMDEEERRLREACRSRGPEDGSRGSSTKVSSHITRHSSKKRPALGPVLRGFRIGRSAKTCGETEKGR